MDPSDTKVPQKPMQSALRLKKKKKKYDRSKLILISLLSFFILLGVLYWWSQNEKGEVTVAKRPAVYGPWETISSGSDDQIVQHRSCEGDDCNTNEMNRMIQWGPWETCDLKTRKQIRTCSLNDTEECAKLPGGVRDCDAPPPTQPPAQWRMYGFVVLGVLALGACVLFWVRKDDKILVEEQSLITAPGSGNKNKGGKLTEGGSVLVVGRIGNKGNALDVTGDKGGSASSNEEVVLNLVEKIFEEEWNSLMKL